MSSTLQADRAARRTLAVAASGTLLTLVAFTAPLATIISTADALGAGLAGRTWVLSSMSIGLGAALLTAGRLADDVGRRRMFVLGATLLGLASLASVAATDVVLFVVLRILQGVGGAAVIAASLGLIAATHPPGPRRAAASGVWGASVGAGIALGPLVSAGLDWVVGWSAVYVVIAVGAGIVAWAGQTRVEESRAAHRQPLDLAGALLLAVGMSALLAGLVEGRLGWGRPVVLVLGATALVALVAFVVVEARRTAPMLDLALFRHPPFVAATVAGLGTGAGVIALMSFLSGFVGLALGISALGASVMICAWSATSVVTALLARRLPAAMSGRAQLAAGLVGVGVGQLAMAGVTTASTWVHFVPGLLVAGVASGVLNAALGREAVASVPPDRAGLGSGANNTARYVGSAVGVTVVSVVASSASGADPVSALASGWNHAAVVTAAVSLGAALVVLAARERRRSPAGAPVASR